MVSSWQVPAAVGVDLHSFGSWSMLDVPPFESQVAYAFVKTRWESELSSLSDAQLAGLARACRNHLSSTDDRTLLRDKIPAIWLGSRVSDLLLGMTLQLSVARATPLFGLSSTLSSPTCHFARFSFGLVAFEALLNLYAHTLHDKLGALKFSVFTAALQSVITGKLLQHVFTALAILENSEPADQVFRDETYARHILFQNLHARLAELYMSEEDKQRPRPKPGRNPLVVEAEERGFREGVKWWLAAQKTKDGQAVSLFGFTWLSVPKLKLHEWEPLPPNLPCFISDVDLREAVCAGASSFLEEKGYKTKVYFQLD